MSLVHSAASGSIPTERVVKGTYQRADGEWCGDCGRMVSAHPHLTSCPAYVAPAPSAVEALRVLINRLETWPISFSTGCCMCGAEMKDHGMLDNHAPTDEGDYAMDLAIREAKRSLPLRGDVDASTAGTEQAQRSEVSSNSTQKEQGA